MEMKRPKIEDYKPNNLFTDKIDYTIDLEKYCDWMESTKYRDRQSYIKDKEGFSLVVNKQEQQIKQLEEELERCYVRLN